jgi:hypothetical protein
MKKNILITSFFSMITIAVSAQSNVLTSGGDISNGNGSVSYSIGQIDYSSIENNNGSVYQGVQQPFEIFTVNVLNEEFNSIEISTFPNPTNQYLNIKIDEYLNEQLNYQLYDFNGKLLEDKRIESNLTTLTMDSYSQATYFLKIINKKGESLKSFKIIKNQ